MPYAVWLTTALLATLPVPVRQPANSALVSGLKNPAAVAVGVVGACRGRVGCRGALMGSRGCGQVRVASCSLP